MKDFNSLNFALSSPLKNSPERIVSLVPSQTELLYILGMNNAVLGITKFCIHPHEWFRTKARIGGTKTVHIDRVRALEPDLILANKEENVKEQVEALSEICPVYVSDINTVDDAYKMIADVGNLTERATEATELIARIESGFGQLSSENKVRTAYLIWQNPYMTVGSDTFIHDMMQRCGLSNVFSHNSRYPQITIEQLQQANCELLLLSSEPYPFKQKHIDELQEHLPNTRVMLTDGEMFSWYGSRMMQAAAYFRQMQPTWQQKE